MRPEHGPPFILNERELGRLGLAAERYRLQPWRQWRAGREVGETHCRNGAILPAGEPRQQRDGAEREQFAA